MSKVSYLVLLFSSLAISTILPSSIDFSQIPILQLSHDTETRTDQYNTSVQSAERNAIHIFNTISSAVRQFGSSYHHNGMSLIPTTVPEGINLYHGTHSAERVVGTEWLAFEIEHAEIFARSFRPPRDGDKGRHAGAPGEPPKTHPPSQLGLLGLQLARKFEDSEAPRGPPRGPPGGRMGPGYLHVYRTNRPLNLIYIDGMSGAKAPIGTLDTQDILLLNYSVESNPMGDMHRARDLCALPSQWKIPIDGFIRMEAGFEIIHCDFSIEGGLDFLESRRRPENSAGDEDNGVGNHPEGYDDMVYFEYMRAVSERYHGIDAHRIVPHFSDMICSYFYPLNLTNPDLTRPDLPRLPFGNGEQMDRMRQDLKKVLSRLDSKGMTKKARIDWQGIVDMITTRYASRLQYIVSAPGYTSILSVTNHLVNTHVSYGASSPSSSSTYPQFDKKASIEKCSQSYITPSSSVPEESWTCQDHLLLTAITTVSRRICETLFDVRDDLIDSEGDVDLDVKAEVAVRKVKSLCEELDWAVWRECGRCGWDEVCFISMWPYGGVKDHYNPQCKNVTAIGGRWWGPVDDDYWGSGRPR